MKRSILMPLAAAAALGLCACSQQAQNSAANDTDAALADANATMGEALNDVGAATESALDTAENAADATGNAIDSAADATGNALDSAGNSVRR